MKVDEAEVNEQHNSIIEVLKAIATRWDVKQINFDVGNCGSVMEGNFYDNLKKLDVQAVETDKGLLRSCGTSL